MFSSYLELQEAHEATIVVTKGLAHTAFRVIDDDTFFEKVSYCSFSREERLVAQIMPFFYLRLKGRSRRCALLVQVQYLVELSTSRMKSQGHAYSWSYLSE